MAGRLPPFLRRYWLAFAIVAAFILLWAALWGVRETRVGLTTALIAPDLFLDAPVSPLKLIGEDPLREEVWLDVPQGRGRLVADVYRPSDSDTHGAMLISVGAAPKIRDHPGVIRLSKTAARAGIVVMIPQLYYPFQENVLPEDVQGLVDAFGTNIEEVIASYQWLQRQPYVDPYRVGILAPLPAAASPSSPPPTPASATTSTSSPPSAPTTIWWTSSAPSPPSPSPTRGRASPGSPGLRASASSTAPSSPSCLKPGTAIS